MRELQDLAGNANRFAVVDVETTGLGEYDRIVEIAVVTVGLHGVVRSVWETLIQPERGMGATEIHGLTSADVARAPTFLQVSGNIAEQLSGACVVGHNISFDVRMLEQEYGKLGEYIIWGDTIDTKNLHKGTLTEACFRWDISTEGLHTAKGDAIAVTQLLLEGYRNLNQAGSAARTHVRAAPSRRVFPRVAERGVFVDEIEETNLYAETLREFISNESIEDDDKQWLDQIASSSQITDEMRQQYGLEALLAAMDESIGSLNGGKMSDAEYEKLLNISQFCDVGKDILDTHTCDYRDIQYPIPCLKREDVIVFTNVSRETDEYFRMVAELNRKGFKVETGLTKSRTKLLIAQSMTTKTTKIRHAQKWGIPIIPLTMFDQIPSAQ